MPRFRSLVRLSLGVRRPGGLRATRQAVQHLTRGESPRWMGARRGSFVAYPRTPNTTQQLAN